MPINFLEMVKNYFTSEFINNASSNLEENTSGVSKALTAIIPTSLAGILNKATSGNDGADKVFEMAKNSVNTVSENSALISNQDTEKGSRIIGNLFGANQSTIQNSIAGYSGLKESSTSSLMSMAMPAIMGILGRHAEQNNLSPSGLAGFLSSQKDHIVQALPSGLSSFAGMFGLGSVGAMATDAVTHIKTPEPHAHSHEITTISERPTAKWLVPLIAILVVVLLLWYFSRSCGETKRSPAAEKDSTSAIQIARPAALV